MSYEMVLSHISHVSCLISYVLFIKYLVALGTEAGFPRAFNLGRMHKLHSLVGGSGGNFSRWSLVDDGMAEIAIA